MAFMLCEDYAMYFTARQAYTLPPPWSAAKLSEMWWLNSKLTRVLKNQETIMAGISDIQSAQAAEKSDLATLAGLITQLLTAFASGQMTPAQAQAVLDEINSEDSTIKTNISSIQNALTPPAPPAPAQ